MNYKLFLIIPPFIHPGTLYHFQVTFIAFFGFACKFWNFQNPFVQISKPDAVNFTFAKLIPKPLIQFHGNVFIIVPVNGWLKSHNIDLMIW